MKRSLIAVAPALGLAALVAATIASGPTAAQETATTAPDTRLLDEIAAATGIEVPDVGDPFPAAQRVYVERCASCHGGDGRGVEGRGPTLENAGPAETHFYTATGRMPLGDPGVGSRRKDPVLDPHEILLVTWYVTLLSGDGTPIPRVDPGAGDLAAGGRTYLLACAACHQAAGAGGALRQGAYAPALDDATPLEIAEAIRIGPGAMPRFGPEALTEQQVNDVVRYVRYLDDDLPNPGGFQLTGIGPVVEGFVAFVVGLGAILLFARWIGSRT